MRWPGPGLGRAEGYEARGGRGGRRGTTLRSCDQSAVKGSWPRTRKSQWMGLPTTSESRSDFYSVSTLYICCSISISDPQLRSQRRLRLRLRLCIRLSLSLRLRLSANCSAILLLLKPWEYLCLSIVVVVAFVVAAFRMNKNQTNALHN